MSARLRRWWFFLLGMAGVVAVGILVFVAQALLRPTPLEVPAYARQTSSDPQFQELVERLVGANTPYGGESLKVQLLPGSLPSDISPWLPTPPNGRLVGSIEYKQGSERPGWQAVYDAPGEVTDVGRFYEAELAKHGWKLDPTWPPSWRAVGGFNMSSTWSEDAEATSERLRYSGSLTFCRDMGKGSLRVDITPMGKLLDVRIGGEDLEFGFCERSEHAVEVGGGAANLIPRLTPPQGVEIMPMGSGGSTGYWHSQAQAFTNQSTADLEGHFAKQLQAAGWTRLARRAEGTLAWSTWKVPGKGDWQGFLYALEGPAQNQRYLYVQAATGSPEYGGGAFHGSMFGWSSSSSVVLIEEDHNSPSSTQTPVAKP